MASITSLTNSTTSSYSNANAITGLASGLDTEAMIEQAVSGYEKKIANIQKDVTMLEWQQEVYRNIIDKIASFRDKYTSYTSSTNMLSGSFVSNSTTTSATGTYANLLSVSGKSTSNLSILGVKQLASEASYSVSAGGSWTTDSALSEMLSADQLANCEKDSDGNYVLEINGKKVGAFSADAKLSTILSAINKADAGVSVSYSGLTNRFQFVADETGADNDFTISGGLAEALFGSTEATDTNGNAVKAAGYIAGQDAVLTVEANGATTEIERSSNKVELDGLTINLKGTFGYTTTMDANGDEVTACTNTDAVKFSTTTDSEKIVDTVKSMVEDYNELVKLVKDTYRTKPLTNSKGKRYEPLTEDDEADMSETAVERYEKKAKTGILFGDQDLSSMYSKLVSAITSNVTGLESIGITTTYSDGLTTLKLDEDKLTEALEQDSNAVSEVLSGSDGASGFMGAMDSVMKDYGATTGSRKGILLLKAGSLLSPTTVNDNNIQKKINDYQDLIERWQEKLTNKVDHYTSMFTRLETLISEMNSVSSALYGMNGG